MGRIKIVIFTLVTMMVTTQAFSQKYMDEIAQKVCDCVANSDGETKEEIQMELGLCMIEAASKYKKQLKRDHNIDFNKIDKSAEKLGRLVGMQMAATCPELLMKMVDKDDVKETIDEVNNSTEFTFEGTISNIEDSKFVVFSGRDDDGKISKFYWLTFIETDRDIISEYKSLKDQSVSISYIQQEFFDSRIGEYRIFNVIQTIDLIK